jgi:hypothetical protein
MIGSTFWENHDSQHILGKIWFAAHSEEKNMIDSTFWERAWLAAHYEEKQDWQHIPRKNMIGSTF